MTRPTLRRALVLALAAAGALAPQARAQDSIEFWTQTYGDPLAWKDTIARLAQDFEAESGIAVEHEVVPWSDAFQTWLTVAQGGTHPDCADMYWLHSFSAIGGEAYGPLPIDEYRDRFPDLETAYYPGTLADVLWDGHFYGIPWRGDIRAMIYNTEAFAEAGIDAPPATWDEIREAARALTVRDANGEVTRWGFAYGSAENAVGWLMPYYWQAGGEFMTADGKTATIDNDAMRAALTFMRDLMWTDEVVSPDSLEKGFVPLDLFTNGRIGFIGSAAQDWGVRLDRDFPNLEGTWAMAPSAKGPASAASFSGAGYFGVLRGSEKVEQCVDWIEFLSRDSSLQALSETSGNVSTKPAIMQSAFWTDRPWKQVVGRALEDAHTSQQPAPAWTAIATPEPGGILYDLMYEVIVEQGDMDAAIAEAQERMQAELAR